MNLLMQRQLFLMSLSCFYLKLKSDDVDLGTGYRPGGEGARHLLYGSDCSSPWRQLAAAVD